MRLLRERDLDLVVAGGRLTRGVSNVKGLNLVSKESASIYQRISVLVRRARWMRAEVEPRCLTTACKVSSLSSSARLTFFPGTAAFFPFGAVFAPLPAPFVVFCDIAPQGCGCVKMCQLVYLIDVTVQSDLRVGLGKGGLVVYLYVPMYEAI